MDGLTKAESEARARLKERAAECLRLGKLLEAYHCEQRAAEIILRAKDRGEA